MTKQELRQDIRRRKAACSPEEREALSHEVTAKLRQTAEWQRAGVVLLYHSLPDEVCTHDLILTACAEGKRVLLPVCVGDDLELREYRGEGSMAEGAFHIQEPTGEAFCDFAAIDLAIIPGVAFTRQGQRLGRGRGYYDRLLSRLREVRKVGLCWPFQLVDELPAEAHDIPMDAVIG
jgi:5-formyltetrahydrofolate cyclo-ligase